MITDIKDALLNAVRKFFAHFGTTALALVLYALLLAVLYAFATTGEKTATQVILSLVVLPVCAVLLFFVLQGLGVTYTRVGVGAGYLLRRALADCWKLLLVSLPLFLLAWLLHYGFGKVEAKLPYESSKQWMRTTYEWLCMLVFYFAVPLMAMQLWIAAIRTGFGATFRGYLGHLVRAFAPRAVTLYAIIWLVCGGIAYLLLFTLKTQFGGPWVELVLLSLRMALAALVVFAAWLISLGALAEVSAPKVTDAAPIVVS